MEEICYERGCKVVKRFVGGAENLEIDALFYWKQMKLTEDGSNVCSKVSQQSGSRVLNILQFLKNSGGEAIHNSIAIVESASDEGVDNCFGS